MTRTATLALVVLAALAAATAASANRAPTAAERAAIVATLKPQWQSVPNRCLVISPRISTINVLFAYVPNPVRATKACLRYKGNGFYILHRQSGKWVVFYQGSDPPVCKSRIPPAVTKDLTKLPCLKR